MVSETEQWFGPGETARRLGVTTKALRVYEREGLVLPRRSESGWRLYGPTQIARLHQIIVLRDLGVSLTTIRNLVGKPSRLRDVLRLQRESLEPERDRLQHAIALIELAQRHIEMVKIFLWTTWQRSRRRPSCNNLSTTRNSSQNSKR